MAIITTGGRYFAGIDGSGNADYDFYGSWTDHDGSPQYRRIKVFLSGNLVDAVNYGNYIEGATGTIQYTIGTGGTYSNLTPDHASYSYQAGLGSGWGEKVYFKSGAKAATSSTPTSSSITDTTATIACNFYPNTLSSSCTASLQYKKTTDPGWTEATNKASSGYSQDSISYPLTGLDSDTNYSVRLVLTRTTINDTSLTSSTHTFDTDPGVPEITTNAASSVTHSAATLSQDVTINSGTGVEYYWKYGETSPPTDTTTAKTGISADNTVTIGITGLSASTLYYHQAFVDFTSPSGSPSSGDILSFTTAADPAVEAAEEDHMHIYEYDGIYGADKDVFFTLQSPAATSSDRLVTTAPGSLFAAGDIKVSVDGGAFASATNSVSQVAASNPLYKLTLDSASGEMSGENIIVQIVDQDGPAFRDALIHVRTKIKTGQLVVDASNLTNTTAATFTGVGSGHGVSAVGGATGQDINGVLGEHVLRHNTAQAGASTTITLDASASATNDWYNGCVLMVIAGTGAGQSRVITDYVGSTKVATIHKAWATNPSSDSVFIIVGGDDVWKHSPGAELSALPTFASNYADLLQFLFQRFVYKRTQTATLFSLYKDNGSTLLASNAVDDDGSTQTHNEMA